MTARHDRAGARDVVPPPDLAGDTTRGDRAVHVSQTRRRTVLGAALGLATGGTGHVGWRAVAALAAAGGACARDPEPAAPAHGNVQHAFTLTLDPRQRTLRAEGTLVLAAGPDETLVLGHGFEAAAVRTADGVALTALPTDSAQQRWRIPASTQPRRIDVAWRADLPALPANGQPDGAQPYCDARGTWLPPEIDWFPTVDGQRGTHRITLVLPPDQLGLVPGDVVRAEGRKDVWHATFALDVPVAGLALIAGPYVIRARDVTLTDGRRVRVRTWFTRAVGDLADGYLDDTAALLAHHDREIGPYAYGDFSVVSALHPTGIALPGLTLIGEAVLRLPFIRTTSLPHEVLHGWWGEGVFVDYRHGNWCEGLTTFMAEHALRARESADAARALRLAWLRDLSALASGDEFPLARFVARTHGGSQIVGYHRAAMLFLMLEDRLGDAGFARAMRRFYAAQRGREASWSDLRTALEAEAGGSLAGWLDPWLARTGLPAPRIASVAARQGPGTDGSRGTSGDDAVRRSDNDARGAAWQLDVTLANDGAALPLDLPLRVRCDGDVIVDARLALKPDAAGRTTATLALPARPRAVLLDPDLRALRRLGPDEAPPILRQVMVASGVSVRVLSNGDPAYVDGARALSEALLDDPPATPTLPSAAIASPTLLIGPAAPVDAWLAARALPARPNDVAQADGDAHAWAARADAHPLLVVSVNTAAVFETLVRVLPHHGRQSWIAFAQGRSGARGTWPAQSQVADID